MEQFVIYEIYDFDYENKTSKVHYIVVKDDKMLFVDEVEYATKFKKSEIESYLELVSSAYPTHTFNILSVLGNRQNETRFRFAIEELKVAVEKNGNVGHTLLLNLDEFNVLISVMFTDNSLESLNVWGSYIEELEEYDFDDYEYNSVDVEEFIDKMKVYELLSWNLEVEE